MNNYKRNRKQSTCKQIKRSRKVDAKAQSIKEDQGKDTSNDISWYTHNPELAKNAANIYFSQQLGLPLRFGDNGFDGTIDDAANMIPGVMSINWIQSWGDPAVTYAARNIYSYIVHANSRNYKYDAPDVMMYLIAMDNIYMWIASMMRVYGVLNVYSGNNRYLPDTLVRSMSFDPEDLRQHLPQFRTLINLAISKVSIFWVPNKFDLLKRHWWLCSNVYTDSDSKQSQMYVFNPTHVYKWTGTEFETGSGLKPVSLRDKYLTYTDVNNITNQLIDAILNDSDIGMMGGDILKAFGSDNLFGITPMPEDYTVVPSYNEEVLMQIHNCTWDEYMAPDIKQKTDGTIDHLFIKETNNSRRVVCMAPILDFKSKVPSPEDIIVATRLSPWYFTTNVTGIYQQTAHCTTELTQSIQVYYRSASGGTEVVNINTCWLNAKFQDLAKIAHLLSKFDWAPYLYLYTAETTSDPSKVVGFIGDTDVCANISSVNKRTLSDAIIPSLFGTPIV